MNPISEDLKGLGYVALALILIVLISELFSITVIPILVSWQPYAIIFLYLIWRLVKAVERL